jgi:hypothetical protein
MNIRKTLIIFGLLAIVGVVLGGMNLVLADIAGIEELPCEGTGTQGLQNSRGFWSTQLTEEQRIMLMNETQEMLDQRKTHEEIREMKELRLQEWGIDPPLWIGPHMGEGAEGAMHRSRDCQGSGFQHRGRENGNQGQNQMGKRNNGFCPNTN